MSGKTLLKRLYILKKVIVLHNAVALNQKAKLDNENIVFLGRLGKEKVFMI